MTFEEKYGKWALVAGAAEGIGLAFSEEIAQKGLNLILIDIQNEKLQKVAKKFEEKYKIQTKTIILDLAKEDLIKNIEKETQSLEVGLLICNAALSPIGNFFDIDLKTHHNLLKINCLAPLYLTYHFGKKMLGRKKGGIVLMSSMAALQGVNIVTHYSASKAYNLLLGEGLWNELKDKGVDVMAVCAGATKTPGYLASQLKQSSLLMPPILEPEKVAKETLKVLGRKPSLITGFWNRLSVTFLRIFFTRKGSSKLVSKQLRHLHQKNV